MSSKFLSFILILINCTVFGQDIEWGTIDGHCSSIEERKLYSLITDYRLENNLKLVQFSQSLSYVARMHAMDLSINRPDFGGCNPHSWSEKGKWEACCYSKDPNRVTCMTLKPKEIAGYKAKAYEIVYTTDEEIKAEDAFNLWKDISLTREYMLNTGKWVKEWKAIGVGIYGNYVCVWFGEGFDERAPIRDCSSDTLKIITDSVQVTEQSINESANVEEQVINDSILVSNHVIEPTEQPRYHIIIGSFNTIEKAILEINKLHEEGYKEALYLSNGDNYRISVTGYIDSIDADRELINVKEKFPDAWILKP